MPLDNLAQPVATLFRDATEIAGVRAKLFQLGEYAANDQREDALHQLYAWRVRTTELPVPLEASASIMEAILQGEKNIIHGETLRLLYGAAISRFITSFTDTSIALGRVSNDFEVPRHLAQIRHEFIHANAPTLDQLRKAADESLQFLWNAYWVKLDPVISTNELESAHESAHESARAMAKVKGDFVSILETFRRDRNKEVPGPRRQFTTSQILEMDSRATTTAVKACFDVCSGNDPRHKVLAEIVVGGVIIPSAKKPGSRMDDAFLLYDKFLYLLCAMQYAFARILIDAMLNFADTAFEDEREAIHEWLFHLLTSKEWEQKAWDRSTSAMEHCILDPTVPNLNFAQRLLEAAKERGDHSFVKDWEPVVAASLGTEGWELGIQGHEMDTAADRESESGGEEPEMMDVETEEEEMGPFRKGVGRFERTPIG